jgi:cell division topological specificity factor
MSVFNLFRGRASAPVARDRLQILLSHERMARGQSDLLGILQEEILTAVAKHVMVERDNVQVRMDRGCTVSTLEIDVEITHSTGLPLTAGLNAPIKNNRMIA